jgi:hypothetical protein
MSKEDGIPSKEELLDAIKQDEVEKTVVATEQYSEVEQEAMERGWTPKEQWEGDPKQWRPADVWLDRGEFLETIRGLRTELHSTKQQVAAAFQQGQKMVNQQIKAELDDLKTARREALQEGDLVQADKLEEKIDEIKDGMRNTQAPRVDTSKLAPPPEFNEFVQRNPWYEQDAAYHYAADGIGYEFIRVNPNATPGQLYSFVEKTMRSKFPELAGKRKIGPPSPDGGDRRSVPREGTANRGGSLSAIKSQMNDMERGIMKTMIQTGVYKSEEEFLKEYAAAPVRDR